MTECAETVADPYAVLQQVLQAMQVLKQTCA
jgi:hypothetical protein